jgi:Skp1 family, tetramerisation domain
VAVVRERITLAITFIGEYGTPSRFVLRLDSSSLPPLSLSLLSIHPTMVLLVTSDNEQFVVEKDVAERSVLIKNMLEGKTPNPIISPVRRPYARLFQTLGKVTSRYHCPTSRRAF